MYDAKTRRAALGLLAEGLSRNAVSQRLGIARATLRAWERDPVGALIDRVGCPRCSDDIQLDESSYAHLLGWYLGDGCLSEAGRGIFALRVSMDDSYPGLRSEVVATIRAVRPGARICAVQSVGCSMVTSTWKHWPCLFPQHGPGRKHTRPIDLLPWQRAIIERFPERLVRGLFHSDGCRIVNWTVQPVGGGSKRYEYPRYFFTNESEDILRICTDALDLLGIAWRRSDRKNVSVARREAVARLDEYVGPKY